MENAPQIIRQNIGIFLVEIADQFYVVEHCPERCETRSAYRADHANPRSKVPKVAPGWTNRAVVAVAKGRKRKTAEAYFHEVIRERNRASFVSLMKSQAYH